MRGFFFLLVFVFICFGVPWVAASQTPVQEVVQEAVKTPVQGAVSTPVQETVVEKKLFSQVPTVCPTCVDAGLDKLTFMDGSMVRGKIVGFNSDAYILYRFGEFKTVDNATVKAIVWAGGKKDPTLDSRVQLVLKSGQVVNGVLKSENEAPAYVVLTVSELNHDIVIFRDQIVKWYLGGKLQTL